jgi:prolycopene isomerase
MEATVAIAPRYDAVVIGAGMGGLAAGGWLARQGLSVGLFEKHSKLGGYGQHFGRDLCFDSDTLMLSGAAPGGWLHAGLEPLGALERIELIPLNPAYRLRLAGNDLLVPADAEALRQELAARFSGEAAGIERFFADMAAMGRDYLSLAGSNGGRQTADERRRTEGYAAPSAVHPSPAALLAKHQFSTAAQLLRSYVRDPRLQATLAALWPLAGLPPAQLSALEFAALWHTFHQQGGTCVPRSGMRQLGQALADGISERGGTVALRTPVRRILRRGRRATGVELGDGTRVECGLVIMNGNPHDLFEELLGGEEGPPLRYEPLQGTISMSAMQVHMGVEMPVDLPAQVNVFHATPDHEASFTDLQREEPRFSSFMLAALNHVDPDRCPAGQQMLVLMALQPYSRADGWNAPLESRRSPTYRTLPEYVALKERIADRLIEAAQTFVPGLAEHVIVRKVATPITMERYTFNTGGAAFGWANIPPQCGALRPGPETPLANLFLAGHWTFPGPGISAALLSGRLAAEAALAGR